MKIFETMVNAFFVSYRALADELLSIYRDAKKLAQDKRYSQEGRKSKVAALHGRVVEARAGGWTGESVGITGPVGDYHRICNELMKLMVEQELFVIVVEPEVSDQKNKTRTTKRGLDQLVINADQ